jgi:hypothetical protein
MISPTDNWTYAEFHAFTMLYAANVDGQVTPDEEQLIIPTLSAESYERIREIFNQCGDADALDIIMSYRDRYCASQEDKDRILADMMEIYQAHAGFAQIEQGVHHLFERML